MDDGSSEADYRKGMRLLCVLGCFFRPFMEASF